MKTRCNLKSCTYPYECGRLVNTTAFDQRLHPPFFCLSGKLKWHMSTRTFSWSSQPKTFTRHILVTQLVFSHLLSQFSVSFHNNACLLPSVGLHEIFEIFLRPLVLQGFLRSFIMVFDSLPGLFQMWSICVKGQVVSKHVIT